MVTHNTDPQLSGTNRPMWGKKNNETLCNGKRNPAESYAEPTTKT